jgi:hypothetical protein
MTQLTMSTCCFVLYHFSLRFHIVSTRIALSVPALLALLALLALPAFSGFTEQFMQNAHLSAIRSLLLPLMVTFTLSQ